MDAALPQSLSAMSRTPYAVGLTGGIGSGKTTVANLFAKHGIELVDTDLIAHSLTAPNGVAISAIIQEFGPEFISADGAMDRHRMRETVFTAPDRKLALERILHPLIRQEAQRAMLAAQSPYVICIVPLLVESPAWQAKLDRTLVIDCSEATQIQRVMHRNQLSESQVLAIMANQVTREIRLAQADDIILNEGDLDAVKSQVLTLHERYLAFADVKKINHTECL